MTRVKRRRLRVDRLILVVVLFLMLCGLIGGAFYLIHEYKENQKVETLYLCYDHPSIEVKDEEGNTRSFIRGTELIVKCRSEVLEEVEYRTFKYEDKKYYILNEYLCADKKDCVKEKELYTLFNTVVLENPDSYKIVDYIKKNNLVSITGYQNLKEDGTVDYYEVNGNGYIASKKLDYEYHYEGLDASIYCDATYYSGGDPTKLDYYAKEEFDAKTKMPEVVKALYINAEAISNADSYIELANNSNINAFVIDIKDCYIDTQLAYNSPVAENYAPSTSNIPNSLQTYQENVKKIKEAGYYVIGRITAFKDDAFAHDNSSESLTYSDGTYYNYNMVDWPSIYSRKMWEYDVALALEAVELMGFDEIQFDYVRSPEVIPEEVNRKNNYEETPSEAIVEFLRYASEMLHQKGVYISADVFGEISGWSTSECTAFVSGYGQFWPAISNCVDAISSMPYPDHFASGAYGIENPWDVPGEIMYAWARATKMAQDETYDPAKCRTWIEVQDPAYREYYVEDIEAQIDALKRAEVYDGFMTWNAASSYRYYAYCIDVLN